MGTNLTLICTVLQLYTNQIATGPPDANGNITVITRVVGQRNSTWLHSSIESMSSTTNVIPSVVQPRPNPQPVTNATPGVATNLLKTVPPVRRGPPTNSSAFKRMQEREAMRTNKNTQVLDGVPKAPTNAVIVK